MPVLVCLVLLSATSVSDGQPQYRFHEAEAQEQRAVRDTVRGFQYDFGVASGYSRIQESSRKAERYATLSLLPEVYYGQFGMGLLATLHVHPRSFDVREEDFDSARDYVALVHFIEYGTQESPEGHARFGSLEDVSLGEGLFLDQYSTAHRLDDPMRGLSAAIATRHLYLEGAYSDLVTPGVFGLHAGYYPFGTTPADVFSRAAVGVGIAGDLSEEGDVVNPRRPGAPFLLSRPPDSVVTDLPVGEEDGVLVMIGVDTNVRWIETETATIATFAEAAHIVRYGVGATLGARGRVDVGAASVQVQYAQRFLGKEFLPDYFNASFEAQRIRSVPVAVNDQIEGGAVNTRRNELAGRTTSALGHQLQFETEWEDTFEATVGYETIWGEPETGRFHLDLELYTETLPVSVRLGYDRFNLQSLSKLLAVSRDNSLYRLGLAYEVIEPLRLGVELSQSFEPVYRGGQLIGQEKQNRVEPYIRLTLRP